LPTACASHSGVTTRRRIDLADNIAAEWFLHPLEMASTPAEAARLRETTIARLLKRDRIRRLSAA